MRGATDAGFHSGGGAWDPDEVDVTVAMADMAGVASPSWVERELGARESEAANRLHRFAPSKLELARGLINFQCTLSHFSQG